jgi:hypothetical protein
MKIFVALVIILQIIPISSFKSGQNLGTGKSCTSDSQFITMDFTVNPYPPVIAKPYTGLMTGVFNRNETLNQLVAKTTHDGSKFATNNFPVLRNYIYGVSYSFNFTLVAGTFPGLYDVMVYLENKSGSYISCWEFAYHL